MPAGVLSLEEQVGQLFWIGFQGTTLGAPLRSLLDRVRPAAIILFARNIENAPQVRSLIDGVNGILKIPPFVALDQEGGRVNRLRPILGPIPANLDLATREDPAGAVRRARRGSGGFASSLCIVRTNSGKSSGFSINAPAPAPIAVTN